MILDPKPFFTGYWYQDHVFRYTILLSELTDDYFQNSSNSIALYCSAGLLGTVIA